jgi:hypothetical protein
VTVPSLKVLGSFWSWKKVPPTVFCESSLFV